MNRLLLARTALAAIGVVVWGYGYRVDDERIRLAGILVLAVSLLLRFAGRWFETPDERAERDSRDG